jgi:hypothetical protein
VPLAKRRYWGGAVTICPQRAQQLAGRRALTSHDVNAGLVGFSGSSENQSFLGSARPDFHSLFTVPSTSHGLNVHRAGASGMIVPMGVVIKPTGDHWAGEPWQPIDVFF